MKKKPTSIFSFLKNSSGGILLPVMTILLMFTVMLIVVTEDYFARQEFLVNSKDFYLARSIEELSINQVDIDNKKTTQYFYYNIGKVEITWNEKRKIFVVDTKLNNSFRRQADREIKANR